MNSEIKWMDDSFTGECLKASPVCSLDKDENIIKLQMCDFLTKCKNNKLKENEYIEREDEEWVKKAIQWRKINDEINDLQQTERVIREQLIALAGNNNVSGGNIKISKHLKKSHIDYSIIPQLMGLDLEKYRKKPIEYWKIS